MIAMKIILEGDGCWPDLADNPNLIEVKDGNMEVALLDKGMASGRPSVAFRIDLPDGKIVFAQTTARLFCMAAKAFMAKYPDLFEGD